MTTPEPAPQEEPSDETPAREELELDINYIVAKAVKQGLNSHEGRMLCSADLLATLNQKVSKLLKDAVRRAVANKRKKVHGYDL
jgi:hypothetical protein